MTGHVRLLVCLSLAAAARATTCESDPSSSQCAMMNAGATPFLTKSALSLAPGPGSQNSYVSQAESMSKTVSAAMAYQLDWLRGYNSPWFRNSLEMLVTWGCVSSLNATDKQRCVPRGNPLAVLDPATNTTCLAVAGPGNCSSLGLCERRANCYWPPPADNRAPYYSSDRSAAATAWANTGYVETFVPYVIPGVFFAWLVLVSTIIFVILRYCAGKCYGSAPNRYGYTKCGKCAPAMVFCLFSLGIAIMTAVAFTQSQTLSDGIVGAFQAMDIAFANLNVMASNANSPLSTVANVLNTTVATINSTSSSNGNALSLANTAWIAANLTTLTDLTTALAASMGSMAFPQGCGDSVPCFTGSTAFRVTFPQSLMQWLHQVQTAGRATSRAATSLAQDIVAAQMVVASAVASASSLLQFVQTKATTSQLSLHDAWSTFQSVAKYQVEVVLAIFLLGLAVAFFGQHVPRNFSARRVAQSLDVGIIALCAGCCSHTTRLIKVMHVSWVLGAFVSFVGFLISASMLVLAVLGNDACHYVQEIQHDAQSLWPGQLASLVDSCYANQSPLDALGLGSSLAFSCSLPGDLVAATSTTVSSLQPLVNQMQAFNTSDFGLSDTTIAQALNQASAIISHTLTRTNIYTPWILYGDSSAGPCSSQSGSSHIVLCYMSYKQCQGTCLNVFSTAYYMTLAADQLQLALVQLQSDFDALPHPVVHSSSWTPTITSINDYATQYTTALSTFVSGPLASLQHGAVGTLLTDINKLKCAIQCSWLNSATSQLYSSVCTNIVGSTLVLSLCIFLMCFGLLPMILCAVVLEKRLRGMKKSKSDKSAPKMLSKKAKDDQV
ncbi:Aste57867_482 [Aphanomyces stellatus]|uniref:Aste57867_482 protein n=1 Tax=Aphanomyces stellatus TaxID=120398 RepID=A0A485K3X8_9STRA|nr:hypothetical protein As57867_000481 [Aphanomyces stellatus]VFT77707.1 Aste57867_482 [Aphanomyces stellatus]